MGSESYKAPPPPPPPLLLRQAIHSCPCRIVFCATLSHVTWLSLSRETFYFEAEFRRLEHSSAKMSMVDATDAEAKAIEKMKQKARMKLQWEKEWLLFQLKWCAPPSQEDEWQQGGKIVLLGYGYRDPRLRISWACALH